MRYSTLLLFQLLLIGGCTSRPQDKAQDKGPDPKASAESESLKNLKAQAEEVGRSAVEENHARMVELTHPALVQKLAGRAAYAKTLESVAAEMKASGFRRTKFTFGEPSRLVQAGGQTYAVVPSELELSGPGGAKEKQPSYLIGVSPDGGVHWTFLDGSEIRGDRDKLKSLLPDFPAALPLPAPQAAVWDKK